MPVPKRVDIMAADVVPAAQVLERRTAARAKTCSSASEKPLDRPSQSETMGPVAAAEARPSFRQRPALPRRSGGTPMFRDLVATLVVALAGAGGPPAELTDKTFASWRDRIRPQAPARCFETVAWLPTFWDGVMAAQKEDKPILLWAMNGHPLACT
jgi:hypothetical protein